MLGSQDQGLEPLVVPELLPLKFPLLLPTPQHLVLDHRFFNDNVSSVYNGKQVHSL